jgi:hypothetical protein
VSTPKLQAFEPNSREGLHVIDTTRTFPRSLREAWPVDFPTSAIGINGPVVIRLRSPWWLRLWQAIKGVWK